MRWNGAICSVDEWQLVFPEKNPERRVRNGIWTREEGVWCMIEETSSAVVINTVFIWDLFWDSYGVLTEAARTSCGR